MQGMRGDIGLAYGSSEGTVFTKGEEEMTKRTIFLFLITLWALALPIIALGVLFSGFGALSLGGLWSDIVTLPSSLQSLSGRLLIWLYLFAPFLLYYLLLRKTRPSSEYTDENAGPSNKRGE